jgi:ketosteroid isomerase-like protein
MRLLLGSVVLLLVLASGPASAQTWTPDQQEIWKLEDAMWLRDTAHDLTWIDTYLHPDATSWGIDTPVPRNRASVTRWDKYEYASSTVLEHELFPLSITITGDVAVVHYRYQMAIENYKKEREIVTGRYSDVLIKSAGRWLLLTVIGGDDRRSVQ